MQDLTNLWDVMPYTTKRGTTGVDIKVEHVVGGYHVYVQNGPTRVAELGTHRADQASARAVAREYAQRLEAGASIQQLIDAKADRETAVLAEVKRTLDDTVPTTGYRTVRHTKTQVFRQPPTAAQRRLLANHKGGLVTLDGRGNWRSLLALKDKGWGTPVYAIEGRPKIAALKLSDDEIAALGAEVAA